MSADPLRGRRGPTTAARSRPSCGNTVPGRPAGRRCFDGRGARHVGRDTVQRRRPEPVEPDDDHAADRGGLGDGAVQVVPGSDDSYADRVARHAGGLLQALQGRCVAVEDGVGRQDRDRLGHPAGQGERGGVTPETEGFDGFLDPAAGLLLHVRVVVDDPRNGLVGDAGRLADVADAGGLALRSRGFGVGTGACVTGHRHARIVSGHNPAVKSRNPRRYLSGRKTPSAVSAPGTPSNRVLPAKSPVSDR